MEGAEDSPWTHCWKACHTPAPLPTPELGAGQRARPRPRGAELERRCPKSSSGRGRLGRLGRRREADPGNPPPPGSVPRRSPWKRPEGGGSCVGDAGRVRGPGSQAGQCRPAPRAREVSCATRAEAEGREGKGRGPVGRARTEVSAGLEAAGSLGSLGERDRQSGHRARSTCSQVF